MLPGPVCVYQCPKCGHFLRIETLASGNTFNSVYYSDGKRISPHLPDAPVLTKCKKCETFLRLFKMEPVGYYYHEHYGNYFNTDDSMFSELFDDSPKIKKTNKWPEADDAEFLEIHDLFRALQIEHQLPKNEELFIRQSILFAFNDRIRNGKEIFQNSVEEIQWEQNCRKLLELLSNQDDDFTLLIAELHRNLGDFKACRNILSTITDTKQFSVKEILIRECKKCNRWVVEI